MKRRRSWRILSLLLVPILLIVVSGCQNDAGNIFSSSLDLAQAIIDAAT